MKILHTSDWHLGHVLYNYDRSREQQAFLRELAETVRTEQPDVMVVSGDVYHYANPSSSAQRMYTEAMLEIHRACEEMSIVVTAGNHDSGQKLEIDRSLWQHFGLHVIGGIYRDADGVDLNRHIIEIKDRESRTTGYVAAIPHIYPNNFPLIDDDTPKENRQRLFFQKILDRIAERNTNSLPVVLMAHLAVSGSDTTGHDDTIGGIDYTDIGDLGRGYDYLALGHIHRPQTVRSTGGTARYSGSPVPVSFDEDYRHSVTIAELRSGYKPEIRTVEIHNPMPLITIPEKPAPFAEALEQLAGLPDDMSAYVRLNVTADKGLPPDCTELAFKAVEGKECKFCYIKVNRGERVTAEGAERISVQELQEISPVEIARRYYKESEGEEMDEELASLMDEAVRMTIRESHGNSQDTDTSL